LLRVEHLKAGSLPALSFAVADGECLAVEGPSGAGKTRLLRAIADLDPAPGHVFVDGAGRQETPANAWRRLVRYVAAEPAWWTDTARAAMIARGGQGTRLERLVAALGLEPRLLDQPLAQLSTGERQRLALVRALLDEPKVLLLDEPTAALDVGSSALVEELLRFQLLSGRSAVLVSHDQGLVERLAHARLLLGRPRSPAAATASGTAAA
jgi:ABC-type iron transport system FetAB ATPase subunit